MEGGKKCWGRWDFPVKAAQKSKNRAIVALPIQGGWLKISQFSAAGDGGFPSGRILLPPAAVTPILAGGNADRAGSPEGFGVVLCGEKQSPQ